ncbi:UbiX family flavin prenyltransferase [Xylanibacillus composti]|uniref:Flavin prenyltransferase UbiX n=1 Tax=Xylanibacillus composti TaxID=1572762 RepID=A0A8J4M176_9BACL|nr:flavin prenyltransferase UbiX [Xylanibacillus composti]MDT9725458.1 UbiX family flavin prenyltransferase [Xylanibacillus composti]GIQ67552.1 flavin prenyltransferase UbiX [Xylanibacillus composti]
MGEAREGLASWVIGITGASGAAYGVRLCQELLERRYDLHLVVTDSGWRVLQEELGWKVTNRKEALELAFGHLPGTYTYYPIQDIGAAIASGSFRTAGMVVAPCSMGTLAAVAHGLSDNLLERAADVMLKEGRPLILMPRETPLHAIHLENMLTLAKLGVKIAPAMPGFYNGPQTLDEIVGFMVGKVMDLMNIDHEIYRRWSAKHE